MKTFRLLATALLVALCTGFYSCSEEADSPIDEPQINSPETYTVSFKLGGEFLTTSETPLTRVDEKPLKKLYGINVYSKEDKENSSYKSYAYGFFDNVNDMNLTLITGYKYKFVCTVVKEDKDRLYYRGDYTDNDHNYYAPFHLRIISSERYSGIEVKNQFYIGGSEMQGLALGEASIHGSEIKQVTKYPRVDRYYGELSDYVPTKNGVANINLKRTVFGVKFIVKPPVDGTLYVTAVGPGIFSTSIEAGKNTYESEETIYTFPSVYDCWKNDDYSIDCYIRLNWSRDTGSQELEPQIAKLKRNIMTTITIDIKGTAIEHADSSLGLIEEDTPMKNENIDITIKTDGEIVETPVNPSV